MVNKKIYFAVLGLLFILGCSTVQKTDLSETESVKAREFLEKIKSINASSPETILSSFNAEGNMGEKKFRVEGNVAYDKKGYYRFTLSDYVFQSVVLEAYRDMDRLYFYYPAEKKLLVDDVNKIDLSMYTGFNAEYRQLYTLLTGGIPLLDNYSVYKCLYDEKEKGHYLILENGEYFENIFFVDGLPEKILIIHKKSRKKGEIYLSSMVKSDKWIFFRKYKIVIPEINTSITIGYSKPQLDTPVKIERFNQEKLPKKTEIVKVN